MNRLQRTLRTFDPLPGFLRKRAVTFAIGRTIKFVGTAGLSVDEITPQRVTISTENKTKVQNHIGTVHAAAMALLAETATGLAVGMHVPDDKIPVIKSMKVDYLKRAKGDMKAVAVLTPEQIREIESTEKGETRVPVTVTDGEGKQPIECTMIWAWTPKRRK